MTTAAAASLAQLKKRVETRHARIGIVGMGYVGLPLALLFSGERFQVTGFDIEERKVSTLNSGGSYIVRILPAAIQNAQKAGFRATSNYAEIEQMDAIIICVPTPLNEYHEPDLSYVTGTVESIAPHLHDGQLVILESTTYPGTTEEIVVPLIEKGNRHGLKVNPAPPTISAFTSPFLPNAKIRVTRQSRATTFPRLSADAVPPPPNSPQPSTAPSFVASSPSAVHRLRR